MSEATDSSGRSPASQRGAVRLVLEEGQTVSQVTRDLDLTETALRERANGAPANLPHSSATGTN